MMDLIIDLDNHSFSVENIKQERFNVVNIYRKASENVEIKKFGFKVNAMQMPENEELIHLYTEDETSHDSDYLFLLGKVEIFDSKPESSVILKIVAYNKRESFEDSFEIKIPRPPSPYPSWKWNEEIGVWEAPTPKPTLSWNEESLTWDLL